MNCQNLKTQFQNIITNSIIKDNTNTYNFIIEEIYKINDSDCIQICKIKHSDNSIKYIYISDNIFIFDPTNYMYGIIKINTDIEKTYNYIIRDKNLIPIVPSPNPVIHLTFTPNKLNVLTYNVWYLALDKPESLNNIGDIISNKSKRYVNGEDYDIILLQEIVENKWPDMKSRISNFDSLYNVAFSTQNKDGVNNGVITIYNKKFGDPREIKGQLSAISRDSRPYLILVFDHIKLIIINVHMPHGNQNNILLTLKEQIKTYINYDIIIGGDFNIVNPLITNLDPRLKEKSNSLFSTCCDGSTDLVKRYRSGHYDHIYSNKPCLVYETLREQISKMSDHLPVFASFDFNLIYRNKYMKYKLYKKII